MESPASTPIIEEFALLGLNGYKDIRFFTDTGTRIVSAENGSGKTTLLRAMYDFFAGNFDSLSKIKFHALEIKIAGKEKVIISKEDLNNVNTLGKAEIIKSLSEYDIEIEDIEKLLNKYSKIENVEDIGDTEEFEAVYIQCPLNRPQLLDLLKRFKANTLEIQKDSQINDLREEVAKNYRLLYFPTFRRIEGGASSQELHSMRRRRPSIFSHRRAQMIREELIHFNLDDVRKKLASLKEKINEGLSRAYASTSASILEKLVLSKEKDQREHEKYDPAKVRVVLNRLNQGVIKTEGIEKEILRLIDNEKIYHPNNSPLRYILDQLLSVYLANSDQEEALQKFVDTVDSYWSADFNTVEHNVENLREKRMRFDSLSADVEVTNDYTNSKIELNALSSGEQQIVGIFAQLYLYVERKYIILIDEPEMSLSIPWQKKLLVDMMKAPTCNQLIAITHSPFVFDNELDKYASSLDIIARIKD